MQFDSGTLRGEKITFSIIIGILLFSSVYISTSTLWLKNENQKFKVNVLLARKEISHLLTFDLPSKDSTINYQRQEILHQADLIQQVLDENKMSEEEKLKLFEKLSGYINQAKKLREQILIIEKEQMEQANYLLSRSEDKKDSLLMAYLKEITLLRKQKNSVIPKEREIEEIQEVKEVKEKASVFYFSARSSDRKNRAAKTDFIFIQLQLRGDLSTLKCISLQVEIRDPDNNIVTDQRDRILANNLYKTEYIFKPLKKTLKKGKYSIRVFCEKSDFQHIDFLTFI